MENNLNILIVEDSIDDFEWYSRLLKKKFTCNIEWHALAESAIEALKIKKYDIILLDYQLTSMNGVEFIRKINAFELSLGGPIIALTGQGNENIAVKFMKLGVFDYIQKKDISIDSLSGAISSALEVFRFKEVERKKQTELCRILIMEDSSAEFERYSDLLKKMFMCDIEWYALPENAIEALKMKKYDFILIDDHLSGMRGVDFIRKINELELELKGPIVALIGEENANVAVEFMHLGVFDYIQKKDVSLDSLFNVIYRALTEFYIKAVEREKQEELCRFAHTIAHDLKSPLSRAASYSKLLSKAYDRKDEYVKNVQEDIQYMVDFLDSLLGYAELGRSSFSKMEIDLNVIVAQSLKNLELEIIEKKVVIQTSYLPKIYGHKISLIQLFQNLIANSIKYCEESARIEIASYVQNNCVTVTVADNGIGIKPEKVKDAFKPFMRLENKLDASGIGLGLALCKTIADQHHATIAISPRVEGGTIVNISFPLCEKFTQVPGDLFQGKEEMSL